MEGAVSTSDALPGTVSVSRLIAARGDGKGGAGDGGWLREVQRLFHVTQTNTVGRRLRIRTIEGKITIYDMYVLNLCEFTLYEKLPSTGEVHSFVSQLLGALSLELKAQYNPGLETQSGF